MDELMELRRRISELEILMAEERAKMELALRESRSELERMVEERTHELIMKNRQLIQEMTEHKEDEEKYRAILENMVEGYYEVDMAGNFTFINASVARILGYGEEELKGMNNRQYSDSETAKKVFEAYNEVYRTGVSSNNVDWNLFRKDGTVVHVETSVSLIRDRMGQPVGFRGIVLDVTRRKQVEKTLQESQQRLAEIIEFLPDATMVIDVEGKVIAWNWAMEEMTNVKAADILGKGDYAYAVPFYGKRRPILIDMALHPDHDLRKKYPSVERYGYIVSAQDVMTHLEREKKFFWATATALLNSDKQIIGAIESIRDITKRKIAEEERDRLISELEKALAEIKKLSGMLPICASCKKIRDDKGYWNQIESYITDHSEAEFSHSICPDCAKKLYRELSK